LHPRQRCHQSMTFLPPNTAQAIALDMHLIAAFHGLTLPRYHGSVASSRHVQSSYIIPVINCSSHGTCLKLLSVNPDGYGYPPTRKIECRDFHPSSSRLHASLDFDLSRSYDLFATDGFTTRRYTSLLTTPSIEQYSEISTMRPCLNFQSPYHFPRSTILTLPARFDAKI
jgi:hypothetical protein